MKKIIIIFGISIFYLLSYSQETDSFTDPRDGKVYKTIKIGTQTWMAENLAYKPTDGVCFWDTKDSSYVAKYGYLYGLKTALIIAPEGWHLPTKQEWETLYDYLGGNRKKAYNAMIVGGGSGFNVLFGGIPNVLGISVIGISNIGKSTGYWSSSRFGMGAYGVSVNAATKINAGFVSIGVANISAYNVRLIKDN
jgi:uncharacterized protein (TIGR02145 family)